jgi:lysozyme family protein
VRFDDCLAVVLESEGGFVDDPADPGGATNLGVTLNTLKAWNGPAATVADVKALTPQTVAPIYRRNYWDAARCGDCPPGVDLMTFDEAVNQGPGHAVSTLQQALGVAPDGDFGPATLAALHSANAEAVIYGQASRRRAAYQALPGFARFGAGWLDRVRRTQAAALTMARD